jgi:hypothetical protein
LGLTTQAFSLKSWAAGPTPALSTSNHGTPAILPTTAISYGFVSSAVGVAVGDVPGTAKKPREQPAGAKRPAASRQYAKVIDLRVLI